MIEAKNLKLCYDEKIVLDNINLDIEKGKITALIGSNGCGKSTLIKAIARILYPKNGSILMEDRDILKMPSKEVAKLLAMLPQSSNAPEDLTIYDLVKQGRYPYHNLLSFWSKKDEEIVLESIKKVGLINEKDRTLSNLSGGQRQRAWIALSLAQDTDIILLDEPTNHLDIKYQLEILNILRDLNEKENRTIVMVIHDINHALKYADNIVAIKNGNILAQGPKEHIINEKLVESVFGVGCKLINSPIDNCKLCVPFI
ncbi:TPA: ABC transporter ATP-binding protein [Clostridium botulinum]|uniref:Ferric enterobactin transport ATP-binding protein FepC n=1 Tax=Clostridium botulinum B str. Osaka05 TaxID=1407017 RepID=A0A0S6TZ52_CLOBO|nr:MULTISPECIES: ABC transporter ATP-binding protein [Clostridium]AUM94697.1 iron ABC transporter ATP-binding protein [Clostridium sporogenes]AVQ52133.1 ABC transporter ATP-binding protein [Clostridium botulinum]GAE01293.1 ferric enterobactin transport ATP-binding protein FepC [Clostridium botulinum B str. Osaka05]HBJ2614444.1 ABC transporter ATP-binding protein [Clostridium botulinum]